MSGKCQLMGIANFTDNSFLQRSRIGQAGVMDAVRRIGMLLSEGADIVDIGACSTAPGNAIVDADTEWARLEPFLDAIFSSFPDAVFSFDTFRGAVLKKILSTASACRFSGQIMVNDIFSGEYDPSTIEIAVAEGLPFIATDRTDNPYAFFGSFAAKAEKSALKTWILDPGFGFGKTIRQNWKILEELPRLKEFGRPVLVALSHKRMIYQRLGLTPDTCTPQSVAAEKQAILLGADIIRTHDVSKHVSL